MHCASRRVTVRSVSCTLFSLLFLSLVSTALAQDTTAIVGATLIDGTGGEPVPDSVIVIQGTRITAVGPRSQVMIPAGARVVDAMGKYVTPGLIDVNVHLILTILPDFYVKYEDQLEEIIIEAAQIALKYEVTTVRDSWGPLEPLLRALDRINQGEKVGQPHAGGGNHHRPWRAFQQVLLIPTRYGTNGGLWRTCWDRHLGLAACSGEDQRHLGGERRS